MPVKINSFEIENVKRVKTVKLEPAENGLTVIGGNNRQGKTSVLDALAWALGGDKYRPSQPQRDGSMTPARLHIRMNNGLVVERKGKNSALKVTDPSGKKAGQKLLDEFISQFALDLPKFMEASAKEKANTLLKIIGVEDKLTELDQKEKEMYNERLMIGRVADQKQKYADEQPYYDDVPKDLVSASDLIRQQQEILVKNGENQRKREQAVYLSQQVAVLQREVDALQDQFQKKQKELSEAQEAFLIASMSAKDLQDESTEELEKNIADVEEINRKVRANLDKEKAEEDAKEYRSQYDQLTGKISGVRDEKASLLKSADLPLPELSVQDGELTYRGQKWDNMSGAEQLKVSTAIVRKLNPQCGFVLMDRLEQMDLDTLQEFGDWLEKEGLQVIATRVSTGDECSIVIEDGYVRDPSGIQIPEKKTWKAGEF